MATATATPSVVATPLTPCRGDCDGNGNITISELVRGVNIGLGRVQVGACRRFDFNGDRRVTVDELVAAVTQALTGCLLPSRGA